MPPESGGWQFWIDRGGTFTDIVAIDPRGRLRTAKLLSENPAHYEDAALEGIARLLANSPADTAVDCVKMGTTVATNALLERRGAPTALVITAGLRDALRIGSQQRPDIFALDIRLPSMLYRCVVEACERVSATGEILAPLDEESLEAALAEVRGAGISSLAIVFMHAYKYPEHERRAAEIAARLGFEHVSVSHGASPLIKLVDRGDTTVLDAYLTPVIESYVESLRSGLAARSASSELLFMQSHGGLVEADRFRGRDSILSGPAGGVVGMAETARAAGYSRVIGFDMGGTSTDVSLYAGDFERSASTVVAGVRIAAPTLRINTVAAGGGSILKYELGRLLVGPESAGADPGPASYRNGGPLTLTDANVYLGRIQPDFFPAVFGPSADRPIDGTVVGEKFSRLADRVRAEDSASADPAVLAAGYIRIAVERMTGAIKTISVERGYDTREFALSCFGGAGGQHACLVADALKIDQVLIHPLAGVLSAYGVGVADLREIVTESMQRPLDAACVRLLEERCARMASRASRAFGRNVGPPRTVRRIFVRIAGSDTLLSVEFEPHDSAARLRREFIDRHRQQFGFAVASPTLIVESVEVEVIAAVEKPRVRAERPEPGAALPVAVRRAWVDDGWRDVPVYRRDALGEGFEIDGPAIVAEQNATTVIETQWRARVDKLGNLVLARRRPRRERETLQIERDPVLLEIFNHRFMYVAEQMGVVLQHTAHSVNIKERLDYSCAIFDSDGDLIANAPHVPVHLGSMGDSVRAVLAAMRGDSSAGGVYMLNAPYSGGTHLPDLTVVTPMYVDGSAEPKFVVASRAHHADIGGPTPGSMPALSTSILEEGVMFDVTRIVVDGELRENEVRSMLASGPHPARNPDQNIADLKAQIAANTKGVGELRLMLARFGIDVVRAYMGYVKANAEECVRRALTRLRDGAWTLELDGGERISVSVRIDRARKEATIDFTGTGPMSPRNYNAPASIARAVVLYVFRTLVEEDIPLNAGCMKPLRLILPPQSLVDPVYPAAVVAGNVETSQCIADALLAALGAAAASQGTMNNFAFGNVAHQYYETLCGGTGAGPGFDGASAVHSHMTNSRLTDPEVLEDRFPVRVRRFEVRRGSGGDGRWRGGDGVVRELEFLEPVEGSLLANRRRTAPFGLRGGRDGAPGKNYVIRADGTVENVGAAAALTFRAGDRFVIETPGGGGFGSPEPKPGG